MASRIDMSGASPPNLRVETELATTFLSHVETTTVPDRRFVHDRTMTGFPYHWRREVGIPHTTTEQNLIGATKVLWKS